MHELVALLAGLGEHLLMYCLLFSTAIRRHLAKRLKEKRRELERRELLEKELEMVKEEVNKREREERPRSRRVHQIHGSPGFGNESVCFSLGVFIRLLVQRKVFHFRPKFSDSFAT